MVFARRRIGLASGRIGLISDTHNLVRPQALLALEGSELIVHAGDIGKAEVLEALERIAPVIAIRGNNDRGPWTNKIPDVIDLTVNGIRMHLIHDVHDLSGPARGYQAVISGHSHQPRALRKDGVLFVNPGSAGPRRFKLPVTVGHLRISGNRIRATIVNLKV